MSKTLVIGHRHPDTDSICSAIAYAEYKRRTAEGEYEARRAGEINEETRFVLDYFKQEEPRLIENVNTQIKDIEVRKMPGISRDITVKKAWDIMMENNITTLSIVDENEMIEGIITLSDLAKSYMNIRDNSILAVASTKYENIIDTINGRMIAGDKEDVFNKGKVLIAASDLDKIEAHITAHDLLIIGNRYDAQLLAIKKGVECIIVCLGAEVDEKIKKLADDFAVVVISTDYDAFTVARLISQAMPISYFMKTSSLVVFEESDYIDNIRDIMASVRYRYFPVLDKNGRYMGMISKRNMLGAKGKQIILVDHNEKSQAVKGMEHANVLEIIDHHRLGSMKTTAPVYFRNQPLGCTATIIYQMYREQKLDIPPDIAGIMCSAIISDTLLFRSPTCTEMDEYVGRKLADIAGINIEEYAQEMFAAASQLGEKTDEQILGQDYKQFNMGSKLIAIGQLSLLNTEELENLKERLLPYIKNVLRSADEDMIFFMLTSILEQNTTLLCVGKGAKKLVQKAFDMPEDAKDEDGFVLIKNVVSRKKQLVPALTIAVHDF